MSIVKSLAVGNGDMFYIRHNSDNFTIIDCCMNDSNRRQIAEELARNYAGKTIRRFISTHPDDDHIRNLTYLFANLDIPNFYCVRNETTKEDETQDFRRYCQLRDAPEAFHLFAGCTRRWMNLNSQERSSAGINILWPIVANASHRESLARARRGENPNNICPILKYGVEDGVNVIWMGDLEDDYMDRLIEEGIEMPRAHIVFVPHHGRRTGRVPLAWLDAMEPEIIVIGEGPSEHLDYYDGYHTITQNSAGDITFDCVDTRVHVYVSDSGYAVDYLDDEYMANNYGRYIGTLNL